MAKKREKGFTNSGDFITKTTPERLGGKTTFLNVIIPGEDSSRASQMRGQSSECPYTDCKISLTHIMPRNSAD